MGKGGEIQAEGLISADEDGLAKRVLRLGTEAKAAVEMMSGTVWGRDGSPMRAGRFRSPTPARCATSLRSTARPTRWTPGLSDQVAAAKAPRDAHPLDSGVGFKEKAAVFTRYCASDVGEGRSRGLRHGGAFQPR
jgi:hypothetical protein